MSISPESERTTTGVGLMGIRVLIVEDHALFRQGVEALMQGAKDMDVVGQAENGRDALRLVAECSPDVVLMDISMPELNGLEATARIVRDYPHVKVLMLSMYKYEEYVLQALRAGAVGYLLKDADTSELEFAIRSVASGKTYLSPSISGVVIGDYVQRSDNEAAGGPLGKLTTRQREILQLIAEGNTTTDMGKILNISPKTMETHRKQLMDNLGIHDIAGLVRYAIRTGLVSLDS
jgi:DNA-binding NarL/FixJ family response regulator